MSAEGAASSTRGPAPPRPHWPSRHSGWPGALLPAGSPRPSGPRPPWGGAPVSLRPVMAGHPPQVDVMPLFSPLTLRNSAMLEKYFWLASATFFSAACGFTISRPWAGEGHGAGWGDGLVSNSLPVRELWRVRGPQPFLMGLGFWASMRRACQPPGLPYPGRSSVVLGVRRAGRT